MSFLLKFCSQQWFDYPSSSLAQAIKEDTSLLPEVSSKVNQIAVTVDKLQLSSSSKAEETYLNFFSH